MQYNQFLEELSWRNMLQDSTPGLEAFMAGGMKKAYIGFDPTAKSLGIGNYVQIMLLSLLQRSGHQPVVVMGGATGRIGDPSGKDKERELKTEQELDDNIEFQVRQLKTMLNFEDGPNKAILINNYEFYKSLNILKFLRDVGKNMTINYMLSKESVKKRLETGISYTEFSYQLLQAYDFYCLYKDYDCRIQMGGSDQWGNITAGTEYIGKCIADAKAYAVTTPLLTKSDGKKFGKSEEGNIWLDSQLTSPYKFYQFWINCDDADLPKLLRYFSLKSKSEVLDMEAKYADQPRELKKLLSEEITRRVHGDKAYQSVLNVTELLFNKNCTNDFLKSLDLNSLEQLGLELTTFKVDPAQFNSGVNIVTLLTDCTGSMPSKSEARRAIQANAISINKVKVDSPDIIVNSEDLLLGKYIMIENGKKNKFIIQSS